MIVREAQIVYRRDPASKIEAKITGSAQVAEWGRRIGLGDAVTEDVVCIALDAQNRPIAWRLVGRGGVASCPFSPSDVLRFAIVAGAAGIVMVHNHPSGECTPSAADHAVTERIRRACEVVGVPMLDHVIVTYNGHYSWCDAGLLPPRC